MLLGLQSESSSPKEQKNIKTLKHTHMNTCTQIKIKHGVMTEDVEFCFVFYCWFFLRTWGTYRNPHWTSEIVFISSQSTVLQLKGTYTCTHMHTYIRSSWMVLLLWLWAARMDWNIKTTWYSWILVHSLCQIITKPLFLFALLLGEQTWWILS